jgi:hypothetical protein
MFSFFYQHTVTIALLLSIFMFSGVVSSSVVLADQGASVQCCDEEPAPASPVNEAECADCGCPGCASTLHLSDQMRPPSTVTSLKLQWLTLVKHPSGYLPSIDYPPEFV